jgi:outer membrane protein OmpA-like peptidoglycan-associated protein
MKAAARLLATSLALALAACSPTRPSEPETLVVVVPSRHDGHVGAVVVNQGNQREVLNTAYAAARTHRARDVERATVTADDVNRIFADASAALPARAASYILYFVLGTQELTDESRAKLGDVLNDVAGRVAAEVIVAGHTDRRGSDATNDALSLQRAERMANLVVRTGVNPEIVHAVGLGEREPMVPTPDGVEEPKNRRVEITVR